MLPYANQQIGGAIGGPIVRDKLHYFLSYERENEPNTILSSPAALPGFNWSFDTKLVQNSFLGKGDWQHSPGRSLHDAVVVLGLGQPVHAGGRHRASVAGRRPLAQGVQRLEHLGQRDQRHRDPGSAGQLQPLRLEEPAGRVGAGQHAELRVPDHHHRAAPQLPAGVLPEHLGAALRPHHQRRRARPRRSAPSTCAGTTPGSGSCCRGASSSSTRPRPTWPGGSRQDAWNDPTRWDLTGLDSTVERFDQNFGDWTIDIPRPTHRPVDRRHLEDQQLADHQRRPALGRRLRRPRPAAHHHHGDLRSARRATSANINAPAGRSPLSGRPARHRQHRPARRLHLERRRQRHLRRPRRQRPLLQHPRLEHDLQPPVVQRRAHPGELVPQRRPAGLHRRTRPAASPRTTS